MFLKESDKALDHRCTNDVLDKLDGSYPKDNIHKRYNEYIVKMVEYSGLGEYSNRCPISVLDQVYSIIYVDKSHYQSTESYVRF